MKDLCQLIQGNHVDTFKKRRKARKGSKLARQALNEALGGESHSEEASSISQANQNFDWDRDFSTREISQYFDL